MRLEKGLRQEREAAPDHACAQSGAVYATEASTFLLSDESDVCHQATTFVLQASAVASLGALWT